MRSKVRPGRFVKPSVLRRLEPALLLALLRPFAAALAERGVALPGSGPPDYGPLSEVLMHPDERTPVELVEALCLIEEVACEETFDRLRGEAARLGLGLTGDQAPEDLALRVYLADPEAIERLHAERLSTKPRKFESFLSQTEPEVIVREPPPAAVEALRLALDEDFAEHHRGRGVRVFPFPTETGFRVLVRRGGTLRREVAIDPDGGARSVAFHPETYDVLRYHAGTGELSVNAPTKRDVRSYCSMVGRHVFGDPLMFDAFSPGRKFTLRPLAELGRGCLLCEDVPGVASARLVSLSWGLDDGLGSRETLASEDVFEALELQGRALPRSAGCSLAVFRVTLGTAGEEGREVPLRIRPPNAAYYARDDHPELLESWMAARGFALRRAEAPRDDLARRLVPVA